MDVGPETFKLLNKMWKEMWKPNKGHNSKNNGPLVPILLPHFLFFREQVWYKFMDVDPETFKLLKKMWKPNKGHNCKSYGPLAPFLLPHLLFFRDHVWYKFHGSRTTNVENIQQNVKSRNYRITELRNDGRTWQTQYSPTFSKRGYKNSSGRTGKRCRAQQRV